VTVGEEPIVTLVAIDDDPLALELVCEALTPLGLQILTAPDPAGGLDLVRHHHPQIVLLDLVMPGMGGMEALERILEISPGTDVILITGHYSTESAVEAIRKGAADYLNKPLSIALLRERIGALAAQARKWQLAARFDDELLKTYRLEEMIGRSPLMLEVFARIRRVAPHFRTILVTGATGTGKELVARALHRLSPAASGPFVVCNASAIVETLFESELFGHVKGAFTGATQEKAGLFESAHRGTLFLDEVGDMPLATQVKLLRVLQYQEIQRVGSSTIRKVDVRVIAATNCDLRALMAARKFREDLFYRFSMVEIGLPRLAERREDLPLLARHFLQRFATQYGKPVPSIVPRAHVLLARHSWPGNVRELENALGHACMMAEGDRIDVQNLPEYLQAPSEETVVEDQGLIPLAELDRRHARRVLERVGGNKTQAAKLLGINRATLYRLLEEDRPRTETSHA
jgi:DNA-binding NtrC family response regulator